MTPAKEKSRLTKKGIPIARCNKPNPILVTIVAYKIETDLCKLENKIPRHIISSKVAFITENNKQKRIIVLSSLLSCNKTKGVNTAILITKPISQK